MESTEQTPNVATSQAPEPVIDQVPPAPEPIVNQTLAIPVMDQVSAPRHHYGVWYVLMGVAVVAALGLGYYAYTMRASEPTLVPPLAESVVEAPAPVADQTQVPALTAGNTTADISADLSQTPDPSAALTADEAAAASAVQGL
ncbi:MAG: hypothetical protein WC217_02770 [Candidatus Paceibacterota bacterium]|jgi:hypothetical protein